jgi:hypothetical protein
MVTGYPRAVAITPSDTVDFVEGVCDAIYVGSGGAVVVVLDNTATISFAGVPTGTVLPIRARRVNSTSTAASSLVALYVTP